MKITYVLPEPVLSGGNKVALQHAQLLNDRTGFEATILAAGPRPAWTRYQGPWLDYSAASPRIPSQDICIATFWTTVELAERLALGPVAHLCQGYEGSLEHNRQALPEIEAVYRKPLPTMVVAPHLARFLKSKFGRACQPVSPPLDPLFAPSRRSGPAMRPRVLVPGIFEAEVKGIPFALRAIQHLKALELSIQTIRISILPLCKEEREIVEPDEYHSNIDPEQVAAQLATADLLLWPSREDEGFGLPVLEAMASGVPVIASDIPSIRYLGGPALTRVPHGDWLAMGEQAYRMLRDRSAWSSARREALRETTRFRADVVLPELVQSLRWASTRFQ